MIGDESFDPRTLLSGFEFFGTYTTEYCSVGYHMWTDKLFTKYDF